MKISVEVWCYIVFTIVLCGIGISSSYSADAPNGFSINGAVYCGNRLAPNTELLIIQADAASLSIERDLSQLMESHKEIQNKLERAKDRREKDRSAVRKNKTMSSGDQQKQLAAIDKEYYSKQNINGITHNEKLLKLSKDSFIAEFKRISAATSNREGVTRIQLKSGKFTGTLPAAGKYIIVAATPLSCDGDVWCLYSALDILSSNEPIKMKISFVLK